MALNFNIAKVTSLPTTYVGSTLYIVPNANATFTDMYVSSLDGSAVKKIVGIDDLNNLIAAAGDGVVVFANHAALVAATAPTNNRLAFVRDISDDTSLTAGSVGGGFYLWDNSLGSNSAWLFTVGTAALDYVRLSSESW